MSDLLAGKTVIVTGVGTGLGTEVVKLALADGADVVMGARTLANLETVASELDPDGERTAFASTDICDQIACDELAALAVDRFGSIDGLVQVAAYDSAFGTLEQSDFDTYRKAFDTNVVGTLQMVKAVAPTMRAQGSGSIVLIGSQSSMEPQIDQMGYAASKGALESAMRFLAKEFGPDRVRVNQVVPSWMWGPPVQMYVDWQSSSRGISEQDVKDEITAGIPLGEIVPDEDVAAAVGFFLSDRSRMITGQALLVNGGERYP